MEVRTDRQMTDLDLSEKAPAGFTAGVAYFVSDSPDGGRARGAGVAPIRWVASTDATDREPNGR